MSERIKVLLVDDEPAARRGVRLLLGREQDVDVVGEASTSADAVRMIGELRPDLVFLDVQMPEFDGFGVIERVGAASMPPVIFVTAFDEYALKAFEVSAVDYLLKPYEDVRFYSAMERGRVAVRNRASRDVQKKLEQLLSLMKSASPLQDAKTNEASKLARPDGPMDRVLIKSGGEIYFLSAEEIDWIGAEGDYMVFNVSGKRHLLRETMAKLEAKLDPKRFIRIHRSTIVNLDRVKKLSPGFVGEYAVILHDGTKLKLSRGYQGRLQDLLQDLL
jgi:two-component system, LytTR family, response regulator